jgi:hypothetical protein
VSAHTLGPFYRIEVRDRDEKGPVLAVSSGFTVPAMGLMHCDSLQIFTRGYVSQNFLMYSIHVHSDALQYVRLHMSNCLDWTVHGLGSMSKSAQVFFQACHRVQQH